MFYPHRISVEAPRADSVLPYSGTALAVLQCPEGAGVEMALGAGQLAPVRAGDVLLSEAGFTEVRMRNDALPGEQVVINVCDGGDRHFPSNSPREAFVHVPFAHTLAVTAEYNLILAALLPLVIPVGFQFRLMELRIFGSGAGSIISMFNAAGTHVIAPVGASLPAQVFPVNIPYRAGSPTTPYLRNESGATSTVYGMISGAFERIPDE